MAHESTYIHGTHPEEQARLSLLNELTNASFIDFLKIEPGDSVLEVGSGLGTLADSIELLKGAKTRLLKMDGGVSESLFEKAISELESLRENPYASAYFYWNRASALKP